MGRESTQQTTPDVTPAAIPSKRHVLPENLEHAVKQLNDDELTQLIGVALKEAKRRGKSPLGIGGDPMQSSRQTEEVTQKHPKIENASNRKRFEVTEVTLSLGKLNAVRAAFKAGVTPSRIAREFGISQANVRKVLAAK
jgi:predicted DNA-binding protein (UPF0251 family)